MEGNEDDPAAGQHSSGDQEELRRKQAHLNFSASHQARQAARQQASTSSGEGGVGNDDEARHNEEIAALFNETFAADTQDITNTLDRLVAESKQRPSQTAAGTGLAGARHAHGEAKAPPGKGNSDASSAPAVDGGSGVREELDALVDRVKGLRKRTAEATLFLTVYELRRAQEEVGRLWASVESTRAELAPRKRFAFRSKAKAKGRDTRRGGGGIPAREEGLARKGVDETGDGEQEGEGGPGLRGVKGREVEILAEDADKDKDFNVADLDSCKVTILHVLGALRLRRLTSCRVVCGPVRGPIYVEGCRNCVIVAAGRQLRIHESRDVDFYVLVASGPIIEDCSGLRFAPAGLRYPEYQQHLQAAGLDEDAVTNTWGDVKDFKWHRAQQSPNWAVIPESERESDSLAMAAPK
ncbi:unnamed protein product [Ectocarpus sp. CCAP 1310/34]|nr:unnamed protein product [Ectocarpus sp. CCAP 1310/34]